MPAEQTQPVTEEGGETPEETPEGKAQKGQIQQMQQFRTYIRRGTPDGGGFEEPYYMNRTVQKGSGLQALRKS